LVYLSILKLTPLIEIPFNNNISFFTRTMRIITPRPHSPATTMVHQEPTGSHRLVVKDSVIHGTPMPPTAAPLRWAWAWEWVPCPSTPAWQLGEISMDLPPHPHWPTPLWGPWPPRLPLLVRLWDRRRFKVIMRQPRVSWPLAIPMQQVPAVWKTVSEQPQKAMRVQLHSEK